MKTTDLRKARRCLKVMRDTVHDPKKRRVLLNDTNVVNAITEVLHNLLYDHYPLTNKQRSVLRRHAHTIRSLAASHKPLKSVKARKAILYKQSGGFLSAILPVTISALTGLLSSWFGKGK